MLSGTPAHTGSTEGAAWPRESRCSPRRGATAVAPPRTEDNARRGQDGSVGRLRRVGEVCLWALVIGATVVAAFWLATKLALVVLPVLLALVLATLLAPGARWLRRKGAPDALAAFVAVFLAVVALLALFAIVVPRAIEGFGDLDVGLEGGIEEVQRWLNEGPLGLTDEQVNEAVDRVQEQIRNNVSNLTQGAVSGAVIVIEVIAGVLLSIVLLFFFLKDGGRIWEWLSSLAPRQHQAGVREAGARSWEALAGFLRGQTIVALFDAVFIGLALVLIGVPLVLPLAVLTFFGAYVPIVGATLAGAAAALVALFAGGPVDMVLVIIAILVVQQLEGNILQPYVVGRSVHVHPVAILLGVTAGGVLAGILGAMVAAPIIAVAGAIITYLRESAAEKEADRSLTAVVTGTAEPAEPPPQPAERR